MDYIASEYSTLNISDPKQKIAIINAMNNAQSLKDIGNNVFSVIGVVCKPGIRKVPGGEPVPCTDTILICADGTAYFTKSEGIRKSVDNFMAAELFDGTPYDMRVMVTNTSNGQTYKTLELMGDLL